MPREKSTTQQNGDIFSRIGGFQNQCLLNFCKKYRNFGKPVFAKEVGKFRRAVTVVEIRPNKT